MYCVFYVFVLCISKMYSCISWKKSFECLPSLTVFSTSFCLVTESNVSFPFFSNSSNEFSELLMFFFPDFSVVSRNGLLIITASCAHSGSMNSISPNCQELKERYDECFNKWFREKYLKGETKDDCAEIFKDYQACVKVCSSLKVFYQKKKKKKKKKSSNSKCFVFTCKTLFIIFIHYGFESPELLLWIMQIK